LSHTQGHALVEAVVSHAQYTELGGLFVHGWQATVPLSAVKKPVLHGVQNLVSPFGFSNPG